MTVSQGTPGHERISGVLMPVPRVTVLAIG